MLVYIFAYILLFVYVLNKGNGRIYKKVWLFFFFCYFLLLFSLRRESVGTDTWQYVDSFKNVVDVSLEWLWESRYEKGFLCLMKWLSLVSKNPQILLIVSSVVILTSVFRFISKYSSSYFWSVFCFISFPFCSMYMSGMRQSLAIALVMAGIPFLLERKMFFFLGFVFLASLFHSSAWICLIYIPLLRAPFNEKVLVVYLLIATFSFIGAKTFFSSVTSVIDRYAGYAESEFAKENYYGTLFIFLRDFIFAFSYYLVSRKRKSLDRNSFLLHMSFILVVVDALYMQVNIFGRLLHYFSFFGLISIAWTLRNVCGKYTKMQLSFLFLMFGLAFFFIVNLFRPQWFGIVPYNFYWE
ncbi:MAG: EpsG family protein [Fibrobacteraceae bacterium]|nr:EpsG family protein [Fibrobacteraceae bacterium]